ncbi:5-dehydro-4-deoxy-D-glucuronate isomerase [Siculibacillus lacustris]|uniref:4-deoxy-L-threo-5-hexosulose-uronate ketol-isomerase n=1 Tax=Siculibacillus lacustris TaxID=1549641 RepID=A0A4Q9VN30_9HYPH|nr:5-dehydro-4-deoxy-D-glucuronate isomerase [Siculibacillus lacustris]TBW37019.1 5-dehydro-4-deoxy-D-glucuronate isomerase [Siculibacillus lacustris]
MDNRHAVHYTQAETLGTEELRQHFLIEKLFVPGAISATLTHYDRLLLLGIMPTTTPLAFGEAEAKPVGTSFFLERREVGFINIGGPARIVADGTTWEIGFQEALYLGMGIREVSFASVDPANPAKLYGASAPAHATHPTRKVTIDEASPAPLGAQTTANARTIYKYFHPGLLPTCQLVMGLTRLEPGSIWNTMPAHTHDRRMEAYLYFELPADAFVVHLMGRPQNTRHLMIRNEQVAVSPPWSIHSGAGTSAYAFIWAMAGDNQSFADMDHIPMGELL